MHQRYMLPPKSDLYLLQTPRRLLVGFVRQLGDAEGHRIAMDTHIARVVSVHGEAK